MPYKKFVLLLLVLAVLGVWFLLDLGSYFTLEYFQARREQLFAFRQDNFVLASLTYFLLYVVVAALSLPAAALITLAGGALFGFWWALLLVSFASTLGATLAFLLARTLLRDWVQARFGSYLEPVNKGMEKDGVFYLFTLRLVPVFPFFLVNIVMALTPISAFTFYWVSQLGMLFGTALYVNVGVQLGLATSLPAVFSIGVIRAIVVLALFPWLAKAVVAWFRGRRILHRYRKPKHFDANVVVIGGGSAGLVTSYIAALVKAKVILIERHRMGGDCLNTGCVPSKTLLRSAAVRHLFARADEFGLRKASAETDFPAVMARVRQVIAAIEPHDSAARYEGLGVECIAGTAQLTSPWTVTVDGREITTRNIVLATGARPVVPDIPGLRELPFLTSDTIWELQELPERLLVLGGGPIGCELAQAFARLGSQVTLVARGAHILSREDEEVSSVLSDALRREGVVLHTGCRISSFRRTDGRCSALAETAQGALALEFDQVLVAVGRRANTENLGLEALGVELAENGTPVLNDYLQTSCPTLYACGDVAGPWQFTHMAAYQAWFAGVNTLFGGWRRFRIDYRVVPRCTFTDPEVARVGLNDSEALAKGVPFEVSRFGFGGLDRAVAEGENRGFIQVLTTPGKDRILGVTIVGPHASELLTEFTLAMTHGLGLKKILGTIHVYPTLSEGNKYVAAQWRKQHAPVWLYPWLEHFHRWRRR